MRSAPPAKGSEGASGTVMVLRVVHAKTVQIERGANSGRSVTYTNAVCARCAGIGAWSGKPESFDVLDLKADEEGYVVLLQGRDAGQARLDPGRSPDRRPLGQRSGSPIWV